MGGIWDQLVPNGLTVVTGDSHSSGPVPGPDSAGSLTTTVVNVLVVGRLVWEQLFPRWFGTHGFHPPGRGARRLAVCPQLGTRRRPQFGEFKGVFKLPGRRGVNASAVVIWNQYVTWRN